MTVNDTERILFSIHPHSTTAQARPLSAGYRHRPSFSLPAGGGVESLFAGTTSAATSSGEEGGALPVRSTDIDLDQEVCRSIVMYAC